MKKIEGKINLEFDELQFTKRFKSEVAHVAAAQVALMFDELKIEIPYLSGDKTSETNGFSGPMPEEPCTVLLWTDNYYADEEDKEQALVFEINLREEAFATVESRRENGYDERELAAFVKEFAAGLRKLAEDIESFVK